MKLKNNRKPKSGKKIKTPSMDTSKISEDMKAIMEEWQEKQRKEQEELAEQTWPTWLLPEAFESWYEDEQKWRKDLGKIPLPNPPSDVIFKVFVENHKDR